VDKTPCKRRLTEGCASCSFHLPAGLVVEITRTIQIHQRRDVKPINSDKAEDCLHFLTQWLDGLDYHISSTVHKLLSPSRGKSSDLFAGKVEIEAKEHDDEVVLI